jgi:hypothetical protein
MAQYPSVGVVAAIPVSGTSQQTKDHSQVVEIGCTLLAYLGRGLAMSVRSALYVLALILAGALLFIFLVFGAIFALVYRNRRPSFSYFASGMTTPNFKVEDGSRFLAPSKLHYSAASASRTKPTSAANG